MSRAFSPSTSWNGMTVTDSREPGSYASWNSLLHARADGGDLGARLLERRAGREARDHLRHAMRAPVHHHARSMWCSLITMFISASMRVGKVRRRLQHAHDRRPACRRRARCLPTTLVSPPKRFIQ